MSNPFATQLPLALFAWWALGPQVAAWLSAPTDEGEYGKLPRMWAGGSVLQTTVRVILAVLLTAFLLGQLSSDATLMARAFQVAALVLMQLGLFAVLLQITFLLRRWGFFGPFD